MADAKADRRTMALTPWGDDMSKTNADFTLRSFIDQVAAEDPAAVWRIEDRVNLDHDVTAVAMELERRGR
ncbi:MAG TPA: hypothetical protein VJK90_03750, partial [Acetobacteraceae bacterium]|nr:hypothetical protein [Acetobacteraceae bacterium]